jgi:hypothetical protein
MTKQTIKTELKDLLGCTMSIREYKKGSLKGCIAISKRGKGLTFTDREKFVILMGG